MSQSNDKGMQSARGVRVALLGIVLLMLAVLAFFIAYSHLPGASGGNGGTFNSQVTPPPAINSPVGTLTIGHSVMYSGLHMTVIQAEEAASFSDDRKSNGAYVVRVQLKAVNGGSAPVGIDYNSAVRLLLPGGQEIAPKQVSLTPVVLPNATQTGYFDFPLAAQADLGTLTLRFGSATMVKFGG